MEQGTPPRYRNAGIAGAVRDYREFSAGQLALLDRLAAMDSPIVAIRFGPHRVWTVFDVDLARQVLVTDEESYERPAFVARTFVEAMGANLFTSSGSAWSRRRRVLQPRFSRSQIDGLIETMAGTIADRVNRWPAGATIDMQARLTDLTLRVAARSLIGLDLDDELGPALRRHFEGVLSWMRHRFFHPLLPPAVVPTRRNRQLARDRAALRSILRVVVAERRRSSSAPADVLQLLLAEATDETGRPPSDEEIVEECIGFLFAGHETTAATLTWALYELALHPEAQDRVAAEGDRLLVNGTTTAEGVHGLEYTSRVVEESLRLYPPGVVIARAARRTTTLGGYRLGRGTVVAISLYAIQRDPRHWPDPGTFDPDRFLAREAHAYLPFGLGPRQCLGTRFATTEARLALATIASRWRFSLTEPYTPRPRIELALRVDGGLPMRLQARHHL